MMKETVDTLGNQKKVNYALRQSGKDAFIVSVTEGLLPPPGYFGMNVMMNKMGYADFDKVLEKGMTPLSAEEFETMAESAGALILDTRKDNEFAKGFIPRSINIGLSGDFAPWVGAMIVDVKYPILLVTDEGKEEEAVTRLSRVGFDNVIGFLQGGFRMWLASGKETDSIHRISASQFAAEVKQGTCKIIDVRKESEYASEHVENADNKPLAYISSWLRDLPQHEHFFMHCAGGYRSMIAASILQSRGYRNFSEVEGGYTAISTTNVSRTNFICQKKV
jgi:rhodanese-related sulfurtransferase